jgi:uncharacterized protein with beta-barrel porin domain
MHKRKNYGKTALCLFVISILAAFFVYTAKASAAEEELESAYKKYTDAINNLDIEQFKKSVAAEVLKKINATPAEQIRPMMETVKKLTARNVTIVGKNIADDSGTLSLTGTDPITGTKINGTVYFVKENGEWKLQEEQWENSTP